MREFKIPVVSITIREELNRYLVEIGRMPLLTIEEEIKLAQERKQGGLKGERAVEKLVNCNLRFVVSVAKQYMHRGLPLNDLIEEGNMGLIKAAWKFDETRGFKFISYAVWWIRQSILQAICEKGRPVRLPGNQVGILHKISQAINTFMQEHHRGPSIEELATMTDIDEKTISQCLMVDTRPTSLDAPIKDGEDGTIADFIPSSDATRTDKKVDDDSMAQELNQVINLVLKEREIKIIRYYFGISCHQKGLEEIGDELGLTRERVRQIREKSITKLRNSGYAKILTKYLG